MELIALPHFHHALMAAIAAIVVAVFLGAVLLWRKKRKKNAHIPHDIYALSKALYPYRDDPAVAKLLQELENYKYRPNPPKVPAKLQKALREALQKRKN